MIFTLAAKELKSLFSSFQAWGILAMLQLILGYLFLSRVDAFLAAQAQLIKVYNGPGISEIIIAPLFSTAVTLLLVIVPLLSMRLLSEEQRHRTLPLLMSSPISMTEIVLGKFIGVWTFLSIMTLLVMLMAVSLVLGGRIDWGVTWSNALGLFLLSGSFLALGLFVSSLSAQPIVTAMLTLGALILLWVINFTADPNGLAQRLSLLTHFEPLNRGFIDTADISYLLLFMLTFLTLTIMRLHHRRIIG